MGEGVIKFSEGTTQDDPLGMTMFTLAIKLQSQTSLVRWQHDCSRKAKGFTAMVAEPYNYWD